MEIEIDQRMLERADRVLKSVPQIVAVAAYDKGLKQAGDVVKKRAKMKAPRSTNNAKGGREKQSRSFNWDSRPLHQLIRTKVIGRGVRRGAKVTPMALVGALHPYGNQINFVHPNATTVKGKSGTVTKRQVYWGKHTAVQPKNKDNDFLKRAFDSTKPQQVRAFTRALIPEIRKQLGRKRG